MKALARSLAVAGCLVFWYSLYQAWRNPEDLTYIVLALALWLGAVLAAALCES